MKWKKLLKVSGWCDKNGLDESFKMSPHLICLSWLSNFHIISRPDPEAGHKRDLGCQPRPIKWGLISKLSMSLFSWHPPKSLRSFFHFDCLSRPVLCVQDKKHSAIQWRSLADQRGYNGMATQNLACSVFHKTTLLLKHSVVLWKNAALISV